MLSASLGLLIWGNSLQMGAETAQAQPWRTADLGFSPQALVAHNGAMWAAGAQESIAVSMDGGRHWALRHNNPKGALLLVFGFVDAKFGYAAGTGGTVLFTRDGGDTWIAQKVMDQTILQAAFGDPEHGITRTRSALQATVDGGKSWQPIRPANDPDWEKKFPYTIDLAALDKDHLAVRVSEGEFGDGEYLYTTDGGKTWNANYIPNVGIHDLIVADGAYYSIGHEVLGKDKPGGGYGVATSFRSRDGAQWEHVPLANGACKGEQCGGCTAQGCFASPTTVVDLENGKSWVAAIPQHEKLSDQWAFADGTLCLLSEGALQCAATEPLHSFDMETRTPITWASLSFPRLGLPERPTSGPQCIRCQFPPALVTKEGSSGPAEVQIGFTIEASGQADKIAISGNLPKDVVSQLRAAVSNWLFEPIVENGQPVSKQVAFSGRFLVMNPDKPGLQIKFLSPKQMNR